MDMLALLAAEGSTVSVPLGYVATVVVALVGAIGVLWRDNLKLRAALLKEKEEKVAAFAELRRMAEESRRLAEERRRHRP